MKQEKIKEWLKDMGLEDTLLFESPCYDEACIGISHDDRLIYDYDKMVEWLMEFDGISMEEAIEFIDYNTIRSLSYAGDKAPIVLHDISYMVED